MTFRAANSRNLPRVYARFTKLVYRARMRFIIALFAACLFATGAAAADLSVLVRNGAGKPVRDAVVTVHTAAAPSGPIRFAWPFRVVQQNMQFDPFVLIVPVGADVAFPNKDGVRHHVYSFSPAKSFELKLYSKDESRSVRFDKVGIIAVGCNIHDSMVAFIKVVDTPYAAKTDASGRVTIRGVAAGKASLRVWHPYMKAKGNEVARAVTLGAGPHSETVVVEVRTPAVRQHGY